jgi:hypothetical protein
VSGSSRDEFEFLVFGGIEANSPYDVIDRTCTFKTRISDFTDSSYDLLCSTIECPSPSLDTRIMMQEAIKVTNPWRVHNHTTKEGEESPSLE